MQIRHRDRIGRLLGVDTREVVLNRHELIILGRARDICERADDLARKIAGSQDATDNPYCQAYCDLVEIVGMQEGGEP